MLASEREGNPTSGRQATPLLAPHVASESPFQVNSPRWEPRRAGHLLWRGPEAPPTASKATGLPPPPQSTSGTSRTRVAGTSGGGRGGARARVAETRSGATQWDRRQDARPGGDRDAEGCGGPALPARPGTCGRSHLSCSEAGGPRGLTARTRGSGSSLADSPCSRGASPPEAATRSASGRRSRPRWPRRRPRSPCRRRRRAADGREPAGPPRPFWPRGRGQPATEGVASRRARAWPAAGDSLQSAPPCLPGGGRCRNLELGLQRQGGAEGRKSSPLGGLFC